VGPVPPAQGVLCRQARHSACRYAAPRPRQSLRDPFIHGTPESCIAQIQALEARTGIHQLRYVFNANGLWSNATALAGMELFAQEALLAVR
jgi:hypothetical protein